MSIVTSNVLYNNLNKKEYAMAQNTVLKRRRIEILIGSESDIPQIGKGVAWLKEQSADFRVSIMSCHRNPETLCAFTKDELVLADVVIAGAGMAAALPGIVKTWLCFFKHPEIPVIGVAFEGKTADEDRASTLSITQLPGKPVELSPEGDAYFGMYGFKQACISAHNDDFQIRTIKEKRAQIGIEI